jgi:hypothetical protein
MVLAQAESGYPLLDLIWTMFVFFGFVLWFWLLFVVFGDLFRRHDIGVRDRPAIHRHPRLPDRARAGNGRAQA